MNMQKNELLKIQIEDMTNEGEGIGHSDGFTLFVKDAVIGDTVLARVTRPKKSYAYARVEQVLLPSPDRIAPACPKARSCGGCRLQELSYERQLAFKSDIVKRNLMRIGGFSDVPMEAIIGMNEPFRCRNKAQYPVGSSRKEPGKLTTGFYAGRTHDIIDIRDCLMTPSRNADILKLILAFCEKNRIPAYDEKNGRGLLRHILIREGFGSGEVLICLILNGRKLPKAQKLVEELLALSPFPDGTVIKSICLNVNEKRTNVILGNEVLPLYGPPFIFDTLGGSSFRISPLSFYQVNPIQTAKLYRTAVEFAGLTGTETVFDLYCGIGTISHFLARNAKEVYGVEIVPEAILDAKENASRNGLANAHFFTAAAEDVAARGYFDEKTPLVHPDVVVVDPPRKGCDSSLLQTIRALAPDRVVYVSCDSATLARDLKILCGEGDGARYELKRVRPCDMFPHTGHVETVCLLSKLSEAKNHISVKVDMDEMDLTAAESKATYQEIQEWVKEKYGFRVSHLNIAKTKRKCGIIERQ
ncbi:MAG: 23S rRNA (uracil(1939)-C(5))-methyltransferase RlmD, partial [Lachnospiraceae bacterium]|nr:23S rRNA (uracil(1939)-C(5))-methyltransferase RlmD [Lachnospiraceae bacterium]